MVGIGIDFGSRNIKTVAVEDSSILLRSVLPVARERGEVLAERALKGILKDLGLPADMPGIASVGQGGQFVRLAKWHVSEARALARGARWLFPSSSTALNLGAERFSAVRFNKESKVLGFAESGECAAGAGLFLDVIARVLNVDMTELSELALRSQNDDLVLGSTCAVFAESEVISLVHGEKLPVPDIVRSAYRQLAEKAHGVLCRVSPDEEAVLCGGIARDSAFVSILKTISMRNLVVADEPEMVSALGAAVLAKEMLGEKA